MNSKQFAFFILLFNNDDGDDDFNFKRSNGRLINKMDRY